MKKPEKVQKSADLAQQNLPGEVALTASQAEFRTALQHSNSSGGSERLAAQANNNATDSLTMSPTSTSVAGSHSIRPATRACFRWKRRTIWWQVTRCD